MKILIAFLFSLFSYTLCHAEEKIEAFKSAFYVDKTVMACGQLVQIKDMNGRYYLNLDKNYPNQSLTLLLWNKDYHWFESKFGNMNNLIGYRLCARGKIEEYKNNLQMHLTNPQYLRLIK